MIRNKTAAISKQRTTTCLVFCFILICLSKQDVAAAPKEQVIVAFGDSLTAGLGVPADKTYPAQLSKKLNAQGYHYKVVNAGVSGETTAGGLRRVDWILKNQPDIVILALGANDGLRGLSLFEMEKNLAQIIERLQEAKVKVILAGMKIPPNYGTAYTHAFETVYPTLAKRFQTTLIPFLLEEVAAKPALNQADGIHPTAQGYQVVVEKIWPIIEKAIQIE